MVEFKSLYGEEVMKDQLPLKDHVVQALMQAFMFQETACTPVDRVFLVYTSRHMRMAVFDFAYAPHVIAWQRDCILEWAKGLGTNYYYIDRRHFMRMEEALTIINHANPPVQLALGQALSSAYPWTMDGPSGNADVEQWQDGFKTSTIDGAQIIEHSQTWQNTTTQNVPLDKLTFDRRADPQMPAGMRAENAYEEDVTIHKLKDLAISKQREYPAGDKNPVSRRHSLTTV